MTKRVAIFDPDLHVCGPATCTEHVRAGFRRAGWEADIISATKSGKTRVTWGDTRFGLGWWRWAPDVVVKHRDVTELLNDYDLAYLSEPKHMTLDRQAVKAGDGTLPYYVEALRQTTTPWFTYLAGPQYQADRAPFLGPLLESRAFAGLVQAGPGYHQTSDLMRDWSVTVLPLPFEPRFGLNDPVPCRRVVGSTGRVVPNKGQGFLAAASEWLPSTWRTELWGGSSIGTGPNYAFVCYEHLVKRDWVGERWAAEGTSMVGADVIRPHPWRVAKNGVEVSYHGAYLDPAEVDQRFGVHVSLTSERYSTGLTEFVFLEGVDAGCFPVALRHLIVDDWVALEIDLTEPPSTTRVERGERDADLEKLGHALSQATSFVEDEGYRRQYVEANRQLLRERHDPLRWVTSTLHELTLI